MKKLIVGMLIILSLSLSLFVACSNKDETAKALIEYNNETWVPVNEMKSEKLNISNARLSKSENESDNVQAIMVISHEILPMLDEIKREFAAIEPKDKKVKKLNDMEIEAQEFLKYKMTEVMNHYEGGDVTVGDIEQNNQEIAEKFQDILDYRHKLMEEYNLEYIEDDESLGDFRNLQQKSDN